MSKKKAIALAALKAGPTDGLDEGEFHAYASVFGNVDSYGDKVMPGAFAETLAAWKDSGDTIPLLFGHNMSDPDFNIGAVVEAKEDDHGLWVHGRLDLDAPKAAQVYRLLKGRRLSQLSFAYDVLDAASVKEDGDYFYELRKLKLYEVSLVPIGANQETEVLAVKEAADRLVKAGRTLSAKNEGALKGVREQLLEGAQALDEVLASVAGSEDEEKASALEPVTPEPDEAKGEPMPDVTADLLARKFNIYAHAFAGQERTQA